MATEYKLSYTASEIDEKLGKIDENTTNISKLSEQIDNQQESSINYDLNVKAINHRGYSVESPENTIPAYIMSKKKGFTYVECDVSFTSDGVAVLLHDNTIDRTSNGTGNINSLTYEQTLQYDFGSWFNEAYPDIDMDYTGVMIPTFTEFIILCKRLGLHPYIELKSNGSYTQAQITQIVNEVERCGMKGKVTYISFSNTFLGYVKNADSSARLGYLVTTISSSTISQGVALKTETNEVFMDAKLTNLNENTINTCISKGLPLEVWTVNTEDEILKMPSYISGVTSDYLVAGKVLYEDALHYVPPISSYIPATGITLDNTSIEFNSFDETVKLTANVEPSDSSDKVVWKSSNTSIATVSNGVVTPKANGSCTITATAGNHSVTCNVVVDVVMYTITRNLIGCKSSSTVNQIENDKAHTETITAITGYKMDGAAIEVTMGGVTITPSYNDGILTINTDAVTGDIVITVAAIEIPTYNITRNLIGCTSSNIETKVNEGGSINETITALNGYELTGATVTITMGGTDVSDSYDSSTGIISIATVTGDIVISITATALLTITRNLTNCASSSAVIYIKDGTTHTETLTANSDYILGATSVTVLMGGTDITSEVYDNGVISIQSVTGNIIINAIATLEEFDLIHNWDFTQSMVDTIGNVEAVTTATRDSDGVSFKKDNVYINLTPDGEKEYRGYTFEIDIPSVSVVNKQTHMRLFSISENNTQHPYHDTATDASTFIHRWKDDIGWTWYVTAWGDKKLSTTEYPKDFVKEKTIRFRFDEEGYVTVSQAPIGTRNFTKIETFNTPCGYEKGYWVIGSSVNNFMYNFTFSAVRVYKKS